jgi:hypothetical protein
MSRKHGTQPEIVPKVTAIYDKDNRKLEGQELIAATAEFFEDLDERPRKFRIVPPRTMTE